MSYGKREEIDRSELLPGACTVSLIFNLKNTKMTFPFL